MGHRSLVKLWVNRVIFGYTLVHFALLQDAGFQIARASEGV